MSFACSGVPSDGMWGGKVGIGISTSEVRNHGGGRMGAGGRPDFGLRPDFGFRPKLGPQKADLSISGAEMHSATRRVFWDASRRRRSPLEAETAETTEIRPKYEI